MISQLPKSLEKLLEKESLVYTLRQGVQEWSKIVAWSWLDDFFVFEGQDRQDEQLLKSCFIKTVKEQSKFRNMYITYGDVDALAQAKRTSDLLKLFLNGQEIEESVFQTKFKIKLYHVLEKFGHSPSIFTLDIYKRVFTYEITVDSYTGILSEDPNTQGHFICTLSYPACPAFGEATVTKEELISWMIEGRQSGEYTPPSPYVPLSSS